MKYFILSVIILTAACSTYPEGVITGSPAEEWPTPPPAEECEEHEPFI